MNTRTIVLHGWESIPTQKIIQLAYLKAGAVQR